VDCVLVLNKHENVYPSSASAGSITREVAVYFHCAFVVVSVEWTNAPFGLEMKYNVVVFVGSGFFDQCQQLVDLNDVPNGSDVGHYGASAKGGGRCSLKPLRWWTDTTVFLLSDAEGALGLPELQLVVVDWDNYVIWSLRTM
jgi:hypothetical protein